MPLFCFLLQDNNLYFYYSILFSHTVSRIATYQELDSDLSKHAAFQSLVSE